MNEMIIELLKRYYTSGAAKTMSFAEWVKKEEGLDLEALKFLEMNPNTSDDI